MDSSIPHRRLPKALADARKHGTVPFRQVRDELGIWPTMGYIVELSPTAVRQLKKLDRQIQIRVLGRIEKPESDLRPGNATVLGGTDDTLIRVGEGAYRIIYTIGDDKLIVLVIRIGHRSEVYRNL